MHPVKNEKELPAEMNVVDLYHSGKTREEMIETIRTDWPEAEREEAEKYLIWLLDNANKPAKSPEGVAKQVAESKKKIHKFDPDRQRQRKGFNAVFMNNDLIGKRKHSGIYPGQKVFLYSVEKQDFVSKDEWKEIHDRAPLLVVATAATNKQRAMKKVTKILAARNNAAAAIPKAEDQPEQTPES